MALHEIVGSALVAIGVIGLIVLACRCEYTDWEIW